MPVRRMTLRLLAAATVLGGVVALPAAKAPEQAPAAQRPQPTDHPPVPLTLAEAWLVPDPSAPIPPELRPFAVGVRAFGDGRYAEALTLLSDARLAGTQLNGYARYFAGLAQLKLSRPAEAWQWFGSTRPEPVPSALVERWTLASAETAELAGNPAAAVDLYAGVLASGAAAPASVLARLASAAAAAGDRAQEESAILRLHAEHPATDEARDVEGRVAAIRSTASPTRLRELDDVELARAERLYSTGRYKEARAAFASLEPVAEDTRDLVAVRLGECDYFLKKYRTAIEALEPYLTRGARQAEARHFHGQSLRRLGRSADYEASARRLADEFQGSYWAQEALNALASHYVVADDDERAMVVFERILSEYPTGRHAERAAWKVGWWQYREGEFDAAAAVFERAAVVAPRSDYRPAWLYWSGRARAQRGDPEGAAEAFRLVVTDYGNSYYGRLAQKALGGMTRAASPRAAERPAASTARTELPTSSLIRALISVGQYELALGEIEFARRTWGSSPVLDATLAFVHAQLGDLRRATIYMKRAYPQYIAAGGERLPVEIRRIIFPMDYADLIATYSRSRGLDPSLVSALIAQESAFQADVKSAANAYGLMQILPRTGRRLARQDGLRRFSTRMLVDPKVNVRLGTRYFAQLLDEFPGVHFALAGYNAGESRVRTWRLERGGMPTDEFIDDIPFPETQGYVKRILSMVEDYRELYGAELAAAARSAPAAVAPASKPASAKAKPRTKRPSTGTR